MSTDAAFLHDLEQCARRVYERHEARARQQAHQRADRIFDRDRRLVIGLTAQLLVSIALIPWYGAGVVLAGLAVLYVGAFASTAWTLRLVGRNGPGGESIERAAREALATCPPLQPGARALLIRLVNLVAIPPTPRSLEMLHATLREAANRPDLGGWAFLDDIAALVDGRERPDSAPAAETRSTTPRA